MNQQHDNGQPEYFSHEEYKNRLNKLHLLQEAGVNPFPHHYEPTANSLQLETLYQDQTPGDSEAAQAKTTPFYRISGRIVLFRAMGKNIFGQLLDQEGRIQFMFNRDYTLLDGYKAEGEEALSPFKMLEKRLDLGDYIGIEGHLFRTHKGELTLYAFKVTLLSKALLPLPEKHAGLSDKEQRYRKRWLDLISHDEVRKTFRQRSLLLRYLRDYMAEHDFMEIETPILQSTYGGAEARPFLTHLNALDQEMFLRISLEISLKKIAIGGMERIFEIGKVFRNEGLDRTHNPEFTMIEAYAAYWDYNQMMVFIENLFETLAIRLHGTTKVRFNEHELDFKAPWIRITMKESIRHYGQVDVETLNDEQMRKMLLDLHAAEQAELAAIPRGKLIAMLFEELVEKHLIQPHHIIDHPVETTPLCKLHRDPHANQEKIVERFESFVCTFEIANSYTELNDPIFQRQLLEDQVAQKEAGNDEAHPLDEEFLEALSHAMPPTGGMGIGIDRMVMLLTNSPSIRDVLYFPMMKPEK
jgi:lysyl-tRNA synthetase class 2